jgi:hypothetical protein
MNRDADDMPSFVDSFGRMSLASFVFEPTPPLFMGSFLNFNACPLPTLNRKTEPLQALHQRPPPVVETPR